MAHRHVIIRLSQQRLLSFSGSCFSRRTVSIIPTQIDFTRNCTEPYHHTSPLIRTHSLQNQQQSPSWKQHQRINELQQQRWFRPSFPVAADAAAKKADAKEAKKKAAQAKKAMKEAAKAKLAAAAAEAEGGSDASTTEKKEGDDASPAPEGEANASASAGGNDEGDVAGEMKGDEGPSEKTGYEKDMEAALKEYPEPVPNYQNPRHHTDPDKEKVFPEDFGPGEEVPIIPVPTPTKTMDEIPASPELHALTEEIVHLNMLEMNELVNKLANHFGFEDKLVLGGGMGALPAGGGEGEGAAAEEPKEEKTAFDLKLVSFDAKAKIKVIKEVRAISGLGLKDAKELVEGAPKVLKKDIKKEEAEELKAKLEEIGAQVEVV